jgi:UDP-N-acetylglucosamine/UDP-N-acetylgalactosamine 4-epimerase
MHGNKYHHADLHKYSFLITGGAGFIGSNLADYLIRNNAGKVRVLDNLLTGSIRNIEPYLALPNFEFIDADIRDPDSCARACEGIDYVSHQAALGSVPRSIKDPASTHSINSTGFLNVIIAARNANVKKFVYASSSSVYGDHPMLPKKESETGKPLSPYAVSKKTNELYADVFATNYNLPVVGLRYFNVFGPNQSPDGPYAAVIPLFMQSVIENKAPFIDGDGGQTRDFTFVENAVQANILALLSDDNRILNQIFNVAVGERVTVNELFNMIANLNDSTLRPLYRDSRPGDIRDSLADISKAKELLKYDPLIKINEGLEVTLDWYRKNMK